VDRRDFLARAELLAACGMTVLISDYFDYYRLAAYLAERTTERIGIVMKLYVYPLQRSPDEELTTVNDIRVRPELQPLYDYLAGRGSFVHLDNYKPEFLTIFSRDVLRRIAAKDESWEGMVPANVAELIKRRAFFGYVKPSRYQDRD
jgi:hypothetical protein